MFATKPGFEEVTARLLGEPDHAYWQLFELTTCQPWYLLTYSVETEDGGSLLQTIAIAWESTLASVVESLPVDMLRGLSAIRTAVGEQSSWTMHAVQALWSPAESEEQQTGPLLFELKGDPVVYDSHFNVVDTLVDGRRLMVSFAN